MPKTTAPSISGCALGQNSTSESDVRPWLPAVSAFVLFGSSCFTEKFTLLPQLWPSDEADHNWAGKFMYRNSSGLERTKHAIKSSLCHLLKSDLRCFSRGRLSRSRHLTPPPGRRLQRGSLGREPAPIAKLLLFSRKVNAALFAK